MTGEKSGGLVDLAYELSLRTLGQQEAVLDELRTRTGTLLTATAVVTSFLGAQALQDGDRKWLSISGLAASVISIVLSVYVLAPKSKLNFALHGTAIYEYFLNAGADLQEAHRTLAYVPLVAEAPAKLTTWQRRRTHPRLPRPRHPLESTRLRPGESERIQPGTSSGEPQGSALVGATATAA